MKAFGLVGVLVIGLFAWTAPAAAGDCKAATDYVSKAVCGSPVLTAQDGDFNAAYQAKLATLQGKDRREFIDQERSWIKVRSDMCRDNADIETCLAFLTARRLDQFGEEQQSSRLQEGDVIFVGPHPLIVRHPKGNDITNALEIVDGEKIAMSGDAGIDLNARYHRNDIDAVVIEGDDLGTGHTTHSVVIESRGGLPLVTHALPEMSNDDYYRLQQDKNGFLWLDDQTPGYGGSKITWDASSGKMTNTPRGYNWSIPGSIRDYLAHHDVKDLQPYAVEDFYKVATALPKRDRTLFAQGISRVDFFGEDMMREGFGNCGKLGCGAFTQGNFAYFASCGPVIDGVALECNFVESLAAVDLLTGKIYLGVYEDIVDGPSDTPKELQGPDHARFYPPRETWPADTLDVVDDWLR